MEQKRTLWIVSAVGVFLLVVVGAALIMYSPSNGGQTTVASSKGPAFNQYGNQFDKNAGSLPPPPMGDVGIVPPPAFGSEIEVVPPTEKDGSIKTENLTVYANNATVYGPDGKALDMNDLKASAKKSNETTINVLPSSDVEYARTSVNVYGEGSGRSEVTVKTAPPKPVAKAEPKPAPKPATKPVAKAPAPKPAPKPAAKPAPKTPDTFWIQIASYEMKRYADEARNALESKKIKTEVFTFEKSGKLYYRVRVGPYTTKSEAQYWQNQIASTSGIDTKGSYIVTGTN